jgi:hypothetical protein
MVLRCIQFFHYFLIHHQGFKERPNKVSETRRVSNGSILNTTCLLYFPIIFGPYLLFYLPLQVIIAIQNQTGLRNDFLYYPDKYYT